MSRFALASLLLTPCVFTPFDAAAGQRRQTTAQQAEKSGQAQSSGAATLVREVAALVQAGKFEEAESAARKVVAAMPQDADAHSILGVVLSQRGQMEESERELRIAVQLDPHSTAALANLGVMLTQTGRADEAVGVFEEAVRLAPSNMQASYNLALLYTARKEYERAIPLLELAAHVRGDDVDRDRKSTRLNSSHIQKSRMPSSA